jgi:hypothetical protein
VVKEENKMLDQAIAKLQAEMAANLNQPYVQIVGNYLLAHLEENPEHAEKMAADDKNIMGSLNVMQRYASAKKVGNVAVLTDAQGFGIVLQYFDCWDGEPFEIPAEPERPAYTPPARPAQPSSTMTTTSLAPKGKGKKGAESPEQLSLFDDAFTPDSDDEEGGCGCEF